jgi:hypothetical protein
LYIVVSGYVTANANIGPSTLVEVPLTADGPGPVRRQVTLPGWAGPPTVSSDGRYVAMFVGTTDGTRFVVFDTRSGETSVIDPLIPSGLLLADPSSVRFFVIRSGVGVSIIDMSGVRTIALPGIGSHGVLSPDGRELFVAHNNGSGLDRDAAIAVFDTVTGVERRRFRVRAGTMAASRDGRELYVAYLGTLVVLDATTGTELRRRDDVLARYASTTPLVQSLTGVVLDEDYRRVFLSRWATRGAAGVGSITGNLLVLDSATLADISHTPGLPAVVVDRTQRVAVSLSHDDSRYCVGLKLEVWDEGTEPKTSRYPSLNGFCTQVALSAPPPEPSDVAAAVTGRRVTLTWARAFGATDYVVEAGDQSTLSNLAEIRTGGATRLVVDNVPPGAYYVRVRSINEHGAGQRSTEIVVVVPAS